MRNQILGFTLRAIFVVAWSCVAISGVLMFFYGFFPSPQGMVSLVMISGCSGIFLFLLLDLSIWLVLRQRGHRWLNLIELSILLRRLLEAGSFDIPYANTSVQEQSKSRDIYSLIAICLPDKHPANLARQNQEKYRHFKELFRSYIGSSEFTRKSRLATTRNTLAILPLSLWLVAQIPAIITDRSLPLLLLPIPFFCASLYFWLSVCFVRTSMREMGYGLISSTNAGGFVWRYSSLASLLPPKQELGLEEMGFEGIDYDLLFMAFRQVLKGPN